MPDLDYAKVIGRFGLEVADTISDPDDNPDTVWCDSGRVLITPLNTFIKVAGAAGGPFTAGGAVIEAEIGPDGRLLYQGKNYLYVVDLTSDKVNPQIAPGKATHKITFAEVMAGTTRVDFPEFTCRLVAAGDGVSGAGVNDLTVVAPVVPGAAQPIFRGEQGTSVAALTVDGGDLVATLTDGTEVNAGPLPVGPGGSDAGVASYLADAGSAATAAARARVAADIANPATPVASALSASTAETIQKQAPDVLKTTPVLAAIRPATPHVVFSFDDAVSSDMTVIKPLLDAKGIKGSFCCHTSVVNTAAHMTWADLHTLEDAGHEIVAHGVNHTNLSAADDTAAAAEVDACVATFAAHDLHPVGFCWAFSTSNAVARQHARKFFRYALGGTGSNVQPLGTYALNRTDTIGPTLATLTAAVDSAIANNKLLVFLTHSVSLDATSTQVLSDLIDYAKTKQAAGQLTITTAAKAFDKVGNVYDAGDLPGGSNYTVIDGAGRLTTSGGTTVHLNPGATTVWPATKQPQDFPSGRISYAEISNTDASWPGGATAGQVITDRLESGAVGFGLQTYSSNGRIWQRRPTSATAWSGWTEVGSQASAARVTAGQPNTAGNLLPSDYTTEGLTITAVGGPTPSGPGGQAGLLLTFRVNRAGVQGYTTQEFHVYNDGGMYRRMSNAAGDGWSAWKQVTLV